MFQLRNINSLEGQSYLSLANLIRNQLKDDITSEDFDIGNINGSNCISILNKEDTVEAWNDIRKGVNESLWCDGLKTTAGSKRKLSNDDNETSSSTRNNTQEELQQVVDVLKKQFGEKYTSYGQRWSITGYIRV